MSPNVKLDVMTSNSPPLINAVVNYHWHFIIFITYIAHEDTRFLSTKCFRSSLHSIISVRDATLLLWFSIILY